MSANAVELEYIEADTEYIQLEHNETMETECSEIPEAIEDNWDPKNIKTMLNLYIENLDKFRNPKVKKKSLWVDIGAVIGMSPDSCDKKFRNLKQTYVRLLKKKSSEGCLNIKWPYFNHFDQIYCNEGEYQPEIQQKILEVNPNDNFVAKALLSIKSGAKYDDINENGHGSTPIDEDRRKASRKRYAELKKVTVELRDRQRMVEEKLDRLISIVEESNSIQRERNSLFEQFLEKLNQKH